MTTTYIANIDLRGREMERPYMRVYVEGETEADALAAAARIATAEETVRGVEPLQPILDAVRENPASWAISWKHEGSAGPVVLTNRDAAPPPDASVIGIPFGSDPDWMITLPWTKRAEARRLASYLGLTLEEW